MQKPIQESELILNPDGSVYHLNLRPEHLANKIIFVGDPERVDRVSRHFDKIDTQVQKREFQTVSGHIGNQRLSVISTGIGTDNIDIVWNEVDALFNIDLNTRSLRNKLKQLHVLRLGTCGGLRPDMPVGTMVNSQYAIGADGLMHFYDTRKFTDPAFQQALETFQRTHLPGVAHFYAAEGSNSLVRLLDDKHPDIHSGITYTAAGFYGPQGRNLGRLPLKSPDLTDILQRFTYQERSVLNLEMETSGILSLGKGLGHQAGSLSVILANRSAGKFHPQPQQAIDKLIETGLEIMLNWE